MYYDPDTPSPELREAIIKMASLYDGKIPKAKLISELIDKLQISSENQVIFNQCVDNEIQTLIAQNQMTVNNIKSLNMLTIQ